MTTLEDISVLAALRGEEEQRRANNRRPAGSRVSPVVVDHFELGNVVVTERVGKSTRLRRLDPAALEQWLEDYSLSELYDKNVFGGLP